VKLRPVWVNKRIVPTVEAYLVARLLKSKAATLRVAWRPVMLSHDRKAIHFIEGIGFGLTAGCLLGILYAPQAGKKTRRRLVSAAEDGVSHITSKAEDMSAFVQKETSRLQNEAKNLLHRGEAAVEKAKAQVDGAIEKGVHLYWTAAR